VNGAHFDNFVPFFLGNRHVNIATGPVVGNVTLVHIFLEELKLAGFKKLLKTSLK